MPGWVRPSLAALLALSAVLSMVLVSVLLGREELVAGDGHYVYAAARSLAYDGDLDLTNQYRVMGDRWGLGRDPATDRWRLPPREIGPSLMMVPGLWLHRALGLGTRWEPIFACLLAAMSLGLCFWGCARAIEEAPAVAGPLAPGRAELLAAAAVLGFVVPYYAVGRSGYAHAPDAAICAGLGWALVSGRRAWLVGALLACAVLMRMQNALWLLWPVAGTIVSARERPAELGPGLARCASIAGIGLLGFAPQVVLALAHPGTEHGSIRWSLEFFDLRDYPLDLLRVLAGAHGLISWTPLAGIGVIGLALGLARRSRPSPRKLAISALAVLVAWCLLLASVHDVDGGDAFGARRLAGATVLVALGLGLAWQRAEQIHSSRARQLRRALALVLAALVLTNLVRTQLAISGRLSLKPPHPVRGIPR